MTAGCRHVAMIRVTALDKGYCEDCVRLGMRWVHLRMCLTCGHVGCCDSSPGRHATGHFERSGHPLIRSAEPGESWVWCYVDQLTVGELPRPSATAV
jgi:uncharacterized UBP type Zn finger protein